MLNKAAAAKIWSAAVIGLDAVPVEVEADVSQGLPKFSVVGLPDTAVQEARERVMAAIKNSGLPFPFNRLTVNLAPADIKKEGPAYDLPMAVAILLRGGILRPSDTAGRLFLGELALDGELRPVSGVLPIALMAASHGFRELYLPEANVAEAGLAVSGPTESAGAVMPPATTADAVGGGPSSKTVIYPVASLPQLIGHLRGSESIPPASANFDVGLNPTADQPAEADFDFAAIRGQLQAKRALEIAAAGGHNLLLSGPPGAGKTLLARSLPTILPRMTWEETLEVTKIYSVAGLTGQGQVISQRPFRTPHHSASGTALIGGGGCPRPGEVSLAHRGVLFLDEFPEFPRQVLENLRQPLEDGFVTISRAQARLRFPSKFILIAAQNPCPCGYASDPERECSCLPSQIAQYRKRVSGPLLDRIDLHLEVPKVKTADLFDDRRPAESSAAVRARVQAARDRQLARFRSEKQAIFTNAEMGQRLIRRYCRLNPEGERLCREAIDRLGLSARGYGRILKIARTIADLDGAADIAAAHLAEALQFRERAT